MKKKVVQFNEKHKWCGAFGYVDEMKPITLDGKETMRYMVGIPHLEADGVSGIAFIFALAEEFDIVGETDLIPQSEEE